MVHGSQLINLLSSDFFTWMCDGLLIAEDSPLIARIHFGHSHVQYNY